MFWLTFYLICSVYFSYLAIKEYNSNGNKFSPKLIYFVILSLAFATNSNMKNNQLDIYKKLDSNQKTIELKLDSIIKKLSIYPC